ncbi:AAA family ATPase [Spiroplasma alleghenense]|uniref:ATPase AAA-type core domain-containing protein n=1 Tax=Spiroplasma alleghenense TaxID=216931 RepID=A0A345Z4V9_9MOLU|nr:AAA family ATPase [Spiroplasma alleghenense]AXK51638.1 hypothetical protein SALLE_v1c09680 [Spiroplasma alleghenense]
MKNERFIEIELENFIHFKDKCTIKIDIEGPPTLIAGPNEAGKTQLLKLMEDFSNFRYEKIMNDKVYSNSKISFKFENVVIERMDSGSVFTEIKNAKILFSKKIEELKNNYFNAFLSAANFEESSLEIKKYMTESVKNFLKESKINDVQFAYLNESDENLFLISDDSFSLNYKLIFEFIESHKEELGFSIDSEINYETEIDEDFLNIFPNRRYGDNVTLKDYLDKTYYFYFEKMLIQELTNFHFSTKFIRLNQNDSSFMGIKEIMIKNKSLNQIQKSFLNLSKITEEELKLWNHGTRDLWRTARESVQKKLDDLSKEFLTFYNKINSINELESVNNKIFEIDNYSEKNYEHSFEIGVWDEAEKNVEREISEYKSTGFIEYLNLFIALYDINLTEGKKVILIDEPGNSLHFDNRMKLIELFKQNSSKIIFTSHNLEMMNVNDIICLQKSGGFFIASNHFNTSNNYWIDLRVNILSSVFGTEWGQDEFKNKNIIIVEGVTDQIIIESILGEEYIKKKSVLIIVANGYTTMPLILNQLLDYKYNSIICIRDNDATDVSEKHFVKYKNLYSQFTKIKFKKISEEKKEIEDLIFDILTKEEQAKYELLQNIKQEKNKVKIGQVKFEIANNFKKIIQEKNYNSDSFEKLKTAILELVEL